MCLAALEERQREKGARNGGSGCRMRRATRAATSTTEDGTRERGVCATDDQQRTAQRAEQLKSKSELRKEGGMKN